MNNYYVYAYVRDNGTPYYVGKGCGKRAYVAHNNTVVPARDKIKFIVEGLTEQVALDYEKLYILMWGCKHQGGVLDNKKQRGVPEHHTDETKRKISEAKLGNIPWNKGKKGLQTAWNKGKKRWWDAPGPAKQVVWEGVSYPSITALAKAHGVSRPAASKWVAGVYKPRGR